MIHWLTARSYVDIAPLHTQARAIGRVSPAHISGHRPQAHEKRYQHKRHVSTKDITPVMPGPGFYITSIECDEKQTRGMSRFHRTVVCLYCFYLFHWRLCVSEIQYSKNQGVCKILLRGAKRKTETNKNKCSICLFYTQNRKYLTLSYENIKALYKMIHNYV